MGQDRVRIPLQFMTYVHRSFMPTILVRKNRLILTIIVII